MPWDVIRKTASAHEVVPNMRDYAGVCASFSWNAARKELDGLPGGGLNIAYDALQTALKKDPSEAGQKIDGYTQDQRFFLNWARVWRGSVRDKQAELYLNVDPHSPIAIRAIASPSDMTAFATAFQCKPGDAMVRSGDKQVKIW